LQWRIRPHRGCQAISFSIHDIVLSCLPGLLLSIIHQRGYFSKRTPAIYQYDPDTCGWEASKIALPPPSTRLGLYVRADLFPKRPGILGAKLQVLPYERSERGRSLLS